MGFTRLKREHLLHLRAATEVHWDGWSKEKNETLQLHTVLSILPITPNIRLLSLRYADINEPQQVVIFGLSTLRTLVVRSCCFHLSTNPMPHTYVTALKLACNDVQTTRHLLNVLASTVEDLEVDPSDRTVSGFLLGGLIELPKVSTFTTTYCPGFAACRGSFGTLKRYASITTLHILFHLNLSDMSLHHLDLLALRSLTCHHRLAVNLVPKRPVTTYVEVDFELEEEPRRLLDSLSKTHAGITNLKLFVCDNFYSLLPSFATSLQHLEQLTLRLCSPKWGYLLPNGARRYSNLPVRGLRKLSRQPLHSHPGVGAVALPNLRWVTFCIDENQCTGFSPERFLKDYLLPVSPMLEEFECLYFAVPSHRFPLYQLPEPARAWKVRRLPDGSWERRGPPPIPIPTPAKTLRAAR